MSIIGIFTYIINQNNIENENNIEYEIIDTTIHDISEEFSYRPSIYGNYVVWSQKNNDTFNIHLYNIAKETEFKLTNNESNQDNPDIYENYIVWTDGRNGDGYNTDNPNYDIYLYDIINKSEIQITTKKLYEGAPKIYGDNIFWGEYDYKKGTLETIMFKFNRIENKIVKLFEQDNYLTKYDVSAQYMVWSNGDILLYNFSNDKSYKIYEDPKDEYDHTQGIPDIDSNQIVWEYRITKPTMDFPDIIKDSNIQYARI